MFDYTLILKDNNNRLGILNLKHNAEAKHIRSDA